MNDTAVSTDKSPISAGWLLLIHQLPAEPAYLRVKTSRRLKALGAVALKSSVYVLPDRPGTREDFHWLRREICDGGGEATLAACRFVQGTTDAEIVELFRSTRNEEYADLAKAIAKAMEGDAASRSDLQRFRQRIEQVRERDHFGAPGRAAAEHALAVLDRRIRGEGGKEHVSMEERPDGVTWVTRKDVYVDRMASSWLIRRFIDPRATFKFVAAEGYRPLEGERRFDMFEGEYTHEGDRCSFETLVHRFGLHDPGLGPIAEIVHEIDCKDDKYGRPETAGIATVLSGIAAAHADDHDRLAASSSLFDGLLERFREGRATPER